MTLVAVTGLEAAAVAILGVVVVGLAIAFGIAWLARTARRLGESRRRQADLEAQAAQRAKADELGAQPPPRLEEMDDFDRGGR